MAIFEHAVVKEVIDEVEQKLGLELDKTVVVEDSALVLHVRAPK